MQLCVVHCTRIHKALAACVSQPKHCLCITAKEKDARRDAGEITTVTGREGADDVVSAQGLMPSCQRPYAYTKQPFNGPMDTVVWCDTIQWCRCKQQDECEGSTALVCPVHKRTHAREATRHTCSLTAAGGPCQHTGATRERTKPQATKDS